MRKHEHNKIFELLSTLSEAHGEIKKFAQQKESAAVIQILADCQDLAQLIGNYIEGIEGEGTETVALLEDYCDLLYQASLEAQAGGADSVRRLHKQLLRIENSVRDELKPTRMEIVFLPYQLSMFDSLESVYLAAKADPGCDAYVIPIPYYDKNPDGSFGEMHYDGGLYPANIPITDWREYDIEARHPDAIFIHNPYDEANHATCVHPNYHSKRLRTQTDLLCAIPYYIVDFAMTKDLAKMPGYAYSRKVYVQSEKVRDMFIRDYSEMHGNRFGTPGDKFVALGSPKLDAVINKKAADYTLPEAWRRLTIGTDGTRKKVVLYNTTIGALLGSEHYVEKIRYVLETFKKRRDVVLWWRPHPLIKATYKSVLPENKMKEYEELVADFTREGWGIYDNSPDNNRPIACTDAYYGDGGSMIKLYKATGKPVMLQGMYIGRTGARHPYFMRFHDDGEYFWFAEISTNALMKMNKKTWSVEWAGALPDDGIEDAAFDPPILYLNPVRHNDAVYTTPYSASVIAKYGCGSGKMARIPCPGASDGANASKFMDGIVYKEFIFFAPSCFPAIVRLNTVTGEITAHDDWLTPLKELVGDLGGVLFKAPVAVGASIWLAAYKANVVIEFNMETSAHHIYEVGRKGAGYSGICFDGEHFWLAPRIKAPVIKWNPRTGATTEFDRLITEGDKHVAFCPPVYCGGHVWLLPKYARHAVKIDCRTGSVTIAEEFEADCRTTDGWPHQNYWWAQVSGDCVYAYNDKDEALTEYNCATKTWRKEALSWPAEAAEAVRALAVKPFIRGKDCSKNGFAGIYLEMSTLGLEDYISYLAEYGDSPEEKAVALRRAEIAQSDNEHADGTAGQAIYDYTKRLILK